MFKKNLIIISIALAGVAALGTLLYTLMNPFPDANLVYAHDLAFSIQEKYSHEYDYVLGLF